MATRTRAAALSVVRVRVPFRRPFVTATGTWDHRESWILRLRDDDRTAYGEAALHPGAARAEVDALAAEIRALAADIGHGVGAEARMHGATAPVRAAVDAMLIGVSSSGVGRRLAQGGTRVPVTATLGWGDASEMVDAARTATASGYGTLKLKIGSDVPIADISDRVGAVRAAVGPDIRLRIDANGAWSLPMAEQTLKALEPVGLEYVEQPVSVDTDLRDVARLRGATSVPVALDEAIADVAMARRVMEDAAADVLVVKPSRVGGIRAALEIAELAASAGTDVVLSTMLETGIGLAAGLAAAAALAPPRGAPPALAHGLGTSSLLASDLLAVPLVPAAGHLVSRDIGALELDDRAIEAYAVEYGGVPW